MERSGFGFRFGLRFGTHVGPKSLRKQGRRDKRKRRKLERRKCGLDMAGAIREALEVVCRKSQNRQKEEKKPIPKWEHVLNSALGSKRGPKQAPISGLTFSFLFVDFVIFSIPPQVPPV